MLGPQNDIVTHRQALPHKDVAAAIETVRASTSPQPAVKLAFELLVLTAARSGEVRGARWAEIDTKDHVWTVPATRTKAAELAAIKKAIATRTDRDRALTSPPRTVDESQGPAVRPRKHRGTMALCSTLAPSLAH